MPKRNSSGASMLAVNQPDQIFVRENRVEAREARRDAPVIARHDPAESQADRGEGTLMGVETGDGFPPGFGRAVKRHRTNRLVSLNLHLRWITIHDVQAAGENHAAASRLARRLKDVINADEIVGQQALPRGGGISRCPQMHDRINPATERAHLLQVGDVHLCDGESVRVIHRPHIGEHES